MLTSRVRSEMEKVSSEITKIMSFWKGVSDFVTSVSLSSFSTFLNIPFVNLSARVVS
jgi:hypothetical protein